VRVVHHQVPALRRLPALPVKAVHLHLLPAQHLFPAYHHQVLSQRKSQVHLHLALPVLAAVAVLLLPVRLHQVLPARPVQVALLRQVHLVPVPAAVHPHRVLPAPYLLPVRLLLVAVAVLLHPALHLLALLASAVAAVRLLHPVSLVVLLRLHLHHRGGLIIQG